MIENDFAAAMSQGELSTGEAHHHQQEQSRRLAMTAGLTKSSEELSKAWEADPDLYLATLKGAISAYDANKNLEEMLVSCIARLACVVDGGGGVVVDRAMEIIEANTGRTIDSSFMHPH